MSTTNQIPDSLSRPVQRSPAWKWSVCGLLLLATMLNYLDRQTLAQTKTRIKQDPNIQLNDSQYGRLEMGFGLAFAAGGVITGVLADRVRIRWLYPVVLLGWSAAGFATAFGDRFGIWLATVGLTSEERGPFYGLLSCRVVLGFFEAGQWPCALTVAQRILSRADRTLGNSIVQSGASLGAVLTPIIVMVLVTDQPGGWRAPFQVIGLLGVLWVVPWLLMVRDDDLAIPAGAANATEDQSEMTSGGQSSAADGFTGTRGEFARRYAVLVVMVIMINLTWHFLRAWMPSFLEEYHHYDSQSVYYFTAAYYIVTDVGCLLFGFMVQWLTRRNWKVHAARLLAFFLCTLLVGHTMFAAELSKGPLLLATLLVVALGMLGLFTNYYSFMQELSYRHQGLVTGSLGCITWICTAIMQAMVGDHIQRTNAYDQALRTLGLAPAVALVGLLLFWNWPKAKVFGSQKG